MAHLAALDRVSRSTLPELLLLAELELPALRAQVGAAPRPCAEVDPETFFAPGETGPDEDLTRRARRVCGPCPVRAACAAVAMSEVVEVVDGIAERAVFAADGVWGGLTAAQRRALAPRWHAVLRLAGVPRPPLPLTTCAECGEAVPGRAPSQRRYCSSACRTARYNRTTRVRKSA